MSGQDRFGEGRSIEFKSAYICGERLPQLLGLDSGGWTEDKIKRPYWNDLQFLLKAPDKHFGINLGAELSIWSAISTSVILQSDTRTFL